MSRDVSALGSTLSREVLILRTEFSESRGQVNTHLGFIKWLGVFISGILIAFFAGAVNVAWNASALYSEVKQQGTRIEKLEKNVEKLDEKLDKTLATVLQRFDQIERRLDKIDSRLPKNVDKGSQ